MLMERKSNSKYERKKKEMPMGKNKFFNKIKATSAPYIRSVLGQTCEPNFSSINQSIPYIAYFRTRSISS